MMVVNQKDKAMKFISLNSSLLKFAMNIWPPLLLTGIKVTAISKDFRNISVKMSLRFYNKNYVGVHFGGSIYAMTDPFYMIMVMKALGPEYYVWDSAADIAFLKPGRSDLYCEFYLTDDEVEDIELHAAGGEKYIKNFIIEIKDAFGSNIAKIDKKVYIKLKK
jgi:hypothetical protein